MGFLGYLKGAENYDEKSSYDRFDFDSVVCPCRLRTR
jgi:hypothetical protein